MHRRAGPRAHILDTTDADNRHPSKADGQHSAGLSADEVRFRLRPLEPGSARRPFDGRIPYKGLEPFREADAGFFFGRDALTQHLVRRIALSTFLLVVGPTNRTIDPY